MELYGENFERLVEDALKHLWEFRRLGRHPFSELEAVHQYLPIDKTPITHLDRGQALHRWILRAMEELRQLPSIGDSPEARYYDILEGEYVKRLKNRNTAEALGLSESTFYRTRREAIQCLADVLAEFEKGHV